MGVTLNLQCGFFHYHSVFCYRRGCTAHGVDSCCCKLVKSTASNFSSQFMAPIAPDSIILLIILVMATLCNSADERQWCGPSANLECRSEMCCTRLAGNTGRKKSPFWHHRTTLSGYVFGTKACIDDREKTC